MSVMVQLNPEVVPLLSAVAAHGRADAALEKVATAAIPSAADCARIRFRRSLTTRHSNRTFGAVTNSRSTLSAYEADHTPIVCVFKQFAASAVAARPASAERIENAGSQMSVFLTGGPRRRPHVLTNSFKIRANPATAPIGRAIWRVGRLYRCQPQTPEAFSNSLISSDNFLWHGTC